MTTYMQTSKEYFRALKIIHYALTMGQIIFGIVAFVVVTMNGTAIAEEFLTQVLFIVVPIFMITSFVVSNILFRKRVETAKGKNNLIEKMTAYRSAIILKLAPLEGGSFFSIIAFFVTGNIIFLSLSVVIIVMFILNQPTKEKAIANLELHYDEEKELQNPDAIIAKFENLD